VAQENGAAPIQMYLMGCPFIPTALMILLGSEMEPNVDYFGGESRVAAVAVSTKDDKEKGSGVS
jgi:hypothetical protein